MHDERERILIADDNVEAAQVLGAGLELHGHEVRLAYDGEQALAVLDEFDATVAILDLAMPHLGGIAAARRIRAREGGRGIWLVALSGRAQPADRWDSSMAGFDLHLAKPASVEELEALLRAHRAAKAAPAFAESSDALATALDALDQQVKFAPHLSSGNSVRGVPSVASRRN